MSKITLNYNISFYDYVLISFFIMLCGVMSNVLIPGKTYILSLLGCVYFYMNPSRMRKNVNLLVIYLISFAVILLQHYYAIKIIESQLVNSVMLVFCGYYIFHKLGHKFRYAWLEAMYVICVISLFFYVIMLLTGWVPNVDFLNPIQGYKGIFVYNIKITEIEKMRNCGPFWEPGTFAGYIIMTFILFFNDLGVLWRANKKKVVVIALALFSTFSSQGYLVAFMLIGIKYILSLNRKNILVISCGFILFIIVFIVMFENMPFLQHKVLQQLELASDWESKSAQQSATRFVTTMIDFNNISYNPIWGNTYDNQILYGDFYYAMEYVEELGSYPSGSGMTSFMASNGIPMFIVWLLLSYRAMKRYFGDRKSAVLLLILLCCLGQGEIYIAYIFFLSLPFMSAIIPRNAMNERCLEVYEFNGHKYENCNHNDLL